MDAETPQAMELSLPQAFLLLATNDEDGKPEIPVFALRSTVAGAILAELDLLGAIELQGKHVRATGATPTTDLQHELEVIRGKSRPHSARRWVSMLEGKAETQRMYEGMVQAGLLEHVGEKHLGLFRAVRYPEKDHAPEAALLKKIRSSLGGALSGLRAPGSAVAPEGEPDTGMAGGSAAGGTASGETADSGTAVGSAPEPARQDAKAPGGGAAGGSAPEPARPDAKAPDDRTIALIALLHAAGLLTKLFPEADRVRASELSKDYWPARAVEDELRMIRLVEEEAPAL